METYTLQCKIIKPIIEWEYTSSEGKKFYQVVSSIEDQLNNFLLDISEEAIHSIRYYPDSDSKNAHCMVLYRVLVIDENAFQEDY